MIDVQPQSQENKITSSNNDKTHITMRNRMKSICCTFSNNGLEFEAEEVIKEIDKYILDYKRLIYSIISECIFEANSNSLGIIEINISKLVEYSYSDNFNKLKLTNNKELISNVIIKVWDHANLAICQARNLKQSENEFKTLFYKEIMPVKENVSTELNDFESSMNMQLISLVGIFTAMSFLVFGGLNSLSIVLNTKDISILKSMLTGCIWGICIFNLIYLFFYFITLTLIKKPKIENQGLISKIVNLTTRKKQTLFQQHSLLFSGNYVLISLLIILLWVYFLKEAEILKSIYETAFLYKEITSILGTFIILVILVYTGSKLIKTVKENKNN